MNWQNRILSDPQVLRGKPCIKGTRIPAALVLGYLAAERETVAILKEFLDRTAADVVACLAYARELADVEAVEARACISSATSARRRKSPTRSGVMATTPRCCGKSCPSARLTRWSSPRRRNWARFFSPLTVSMQKQTTPAAWPVA